MGERNAGNLDLLGGRLCLDFANTVDWRLGSRPEDLLSSYADLAAWGRHAGILTAGEARCLLRAAAASPSAAAAVFNRAIALRETIYRIFSSVPRARMPSEQDVERLNREISESMRHMRLARRTGGFEWCWEKQRGRNSGNGDKMNTALDRPLWPIVKSAAALLTSGELQRVRQCRDERCGWLFFDGSRNRSRRWCAMKDCGNRAKARRHYRKARVRA